MNSLFDIDLKNTHPTNKGINKKDKTSLLFLLKSLPTLTL